MSSDTTVCPPQIPTSLRLPAALLAAAILLPPGLNLVQYWLHNPLYGYGLWVPVLAIALAWNRGFCADPVRPVWLTALVIAGYFASLPVLRVVQIANPDWRMIDWLLAGGAVVALLALVFRMGGPTLLSRWWFPICFLLTAVPWSTSAERTFTTHSLPAVAAVAAEVLSIMGFATVDDGRSLHTAVGPIGVSEDCSGIRGFQLAVMASLFWTGLFGLRYWRAGAMLVGGLALALMLNVLRVVVIVGAAVKTGQVATADRLHDLAGTVAQIALMVALPCLGWWLHRSAAPSESATDAPESDRLAPTELASISLWSALCALAWCASVEVAAESWFRIHEARSAPDSVRWTVQRDHSIADATEEAMPTTVRENYRFSDSLALAWKGTTGSEWRFFWLDFEKGNLSACTHNVHRPETCLPFKDFSLAHQFPDLRVELGKTHVDLRHQLFRRRGQVLHIFSVTAMESAATGQQTLTDWTFAGRLRAAELGIRSQHSQMVYLLLDAPASPAEARSNAANYLRQLLTVAGSSPPI